MKILNTKLQTKFKLRSQKNYPTKGVEFIDISPLIINTDVFNEIVDLFIEEIVNKKIDYLLLPEARGFLFGTPVAALLDIGVIPVRKKGKLSPKYIETSIEYEKEYGKDVMELPKLIDGGYEGKNFYIIDDVFATGNTIKSIRKTIKDLGGKVVGYGAVINIPELNKDKKVFSLIDISYS